MGWRQTEDEAGNELRWNSEDLRGGLRSSDFILQAVEEPEGGARGDFSEEVWHAALRRRRGEQVERAAGWLSFWKAAVLLFVASGHCPSIPDGQLSKVFWFNGYVFVKISGNPGRKTGQSS